MLVVCRRALGCKSRSALCGQFNFGKDFVSVAVTASWGLLSLHQTVNCAVFTQRRFNSTVIRDDGEEDGGQSSKTIFSPKMTEKLTEKNEQQEALNSLLEEVQVVLSRPVPIGSLFRALSPASKKTLVKNKEPLEQLLLRYPQHFAVYQHGNMRNRTIYCAPAHLVPEKAHRMFLDEPSPLIATAKEKSATSSVSSSSCMSSSSSPSSSSPESSELSNNINERVLKYDPLAEKQRKINTVLQYIPNEWSPFTELGIPEEVRVRCMGKPAVKAFQYFEKHPQYFEVRQQGLTDHTFYVRRSLALQRSTEKSP